MPASKGFMKGTTRQKVNGLLRHLEMVMRQDNVDEEWNATHPKKQRTRFTDSDTVQQALSVVKDQCEWMLYGSE